jgi:aryl-alcohol dehydrogenase-like predicted oxidoreductase
VQSIFNIFRQRPAGLFFEQALKRDIGVIVRVPLASGLLTGKLSRQSHFSENDHRTFNRHGEHFDVGETFSGVDYELGLDAVEELRPLVPEGATMAQLALRWILGFDAVSTIIPGAKSSEQARANAAAADLAPLSDEARAAIDRIYRERIAPQVHQRW